MFENCVHIFIFLLFINIRLNINSTFHINFTHFALITSKRSCKVEFEMIVDFIVIHSTFTDDFQIVDDYFILVMMFLKDGFYFYY